MRHIIIICSLFIVFGCKKEDNNVLPKNDSFDMPQSTIIISPHIYMIDAILNGDTIKRDNYDSVIVLNNVSKMYLFSVNNNGERPYIQFSVNDTLTTKNYYGDAYDEFKVCFNLQNNDSTYTAFCSFCGICTTNGSVSVDEIRNDYIWAAFNLVVGDVMAQPVVFAGKLNGLPY